MQGFNAVAPLLRAITRRPTVDGQIVPRQRGGLTTAATVTGDIELLITLPGPGSASPFARAQLVRDDGETLLTDPGYTATILEMTGIWWTDTATGETGLTVKVTPLRSDFEEPIGFSGLTVLGMSCAPSSASVGGSDVGLAWNATTGVTTVFVGATAGAGGALTARIVAGACSKRPPAASPDTAGDHGPFACAGSPCPSPTVDCGYLSAACDSAIGKYHVTLTDADGSEVGRATTIRSICGGSCEGKYSITADSGH